MKVGFSIQERLKQCEQIWIETPDIKRTVARMTTCMERAAYAAEPPCMFLSGLSGVGKSLTAGVLMDRHPRTEVRDKTGSRTIVPILYALIPSPGEIGAMVSALLRRIGDPLAEKGTIDQKTGRLRTLLKACEVKLIIMDEFQHLAEQGKQHVLHRSADWVKNLITETGLPIVVVGVPRARRIFDANAQLRSRFGNQVWLKPYDWKVPARQAEFLKFLDLVDRQLPFSERARLADTEIALALYQASSGIPRQFMHVIRAAAIRAVHHGAPTIRREDLIVGYVEELNHYEGNFPNPFVTPTPPSQVVDSGEFADKDEW